MKVKVIKCSQDNYWYVNNIGTVYEVQQAIHNQNDYTVITLFTGNLLKTDCALLDPLEEIIDKIRREIK